LVDPPVRIESLLVLKGSVMKVVAIAVVVFAGGLMLFQSFGPPGKPPTAFPSSSNSPRSWTAVALGTSTKRPQSEAVRRGRPVGAGFGARFAILQFLQATAAKAIPLPRR
jgi:hypothetical protein